MLNTDLTPATADRIARGVALRLQTAGTDGFVPMPQQADNGDEARYADKSGTYTKGLLQTGIGLVDLAAYDSLKRALSTGSPGDFAALVQGGLRTQNGPQGGLAFYLRSREASQFSVPPAPTLASEDYAAELVELYWASLLRDIPFAAYATDATAAKAAVALTSLGAYAGPRDAGGTVTPDLLFRGKFKGEDIGPYLSQFLLLKTKLGALPITQRYMTNMAEDFVTSEADFLAVQNGNVPGSLTPAPDQLYLHDGRGLAAYTHVDVLYQAYFVANLILDAISGADKSVLNPGHPYAPGQPAANTQNGFASFGGPDVAGTLAAVAVEALKAVWYQKWWVHLRHRPESGGGIVHLARTGRGNTIQGKLSDTVVNSSAVQASFDRYGTYLLSQAFPEGSPLHPAYPTGHGTVAGACITVLKFFYNGDFILADPMVPTPDWKDLQDYVAPAGEAPLTVNGELHKIASNISFGHGTHAGIHWRSDTLTSIQLGEAVALSYLRDQAATYNERFSIGITKLDGSQTTIGNM